MNNKRQIIQSFILGFLLGGAAVYTGIHFYRHYCKGTAVWGKHHKYNSEKMLEKLTKKLDLNTEQKNQVEKILESKFPKFKELKDSMKPQFQALRESLETEIRAVLTPEQQEKFDKLVEEFEKRRKKWEEKRGQEK